MCEQEIKEVSINETRLGWGWGYGMFGVFLLLVFLIIKIPEAIDFIRNNYMSILWCAGWTAIGIGLGLYNSRTTRGATKILGSHKLILESHKHYYTLFLFVLFVGTIAAFIALKYSYAAACLTAISIGFLGDRLTEKIGNLIKK